MPLTSTAWKPGESGNPGGRAAEKLIHDAIRVALLEIDKDAPNRTTRLRRIADKLTLMAIDGDKEAMSMIFDRIDGKPTQAVQHETGGQPLLSFLVQIAEPDPQAKVIEHQAGDDPAQTPDKPDASKA